MGWYVRKSLNLGLLRINFSRRGLGASAGVKGARVGVDAAGKPYVHAGRFGLYYRQTLGAPESPEVPEAKPSVPMWLVVLAIALIFGVLILTLG